MGERQAGEMVRKTIGQTLYIFETSVEYLGTHTFREIKMKICNFREVWDVFESHYEAGDGPSNESRWDFPESMRNEKSKEDPSLRAWTFGEW